MKAFLSHSSHDKPFVRDVAKTLGLMQVELDEKTFEHNFNVSVIRDALKRADIFVYFLSQNSVSSPFVAEEQRAALEMRGKGFLKRVMVFALDQSTYRALPPWMQEINIAQIIGSPKNCARQIQAALLELAAQEDPGLALYMGREDDEACLRRALAVPPSKTPLFVHAVGHYGIGRRTYLAQSLRKLCPRLFSTFVEISLANFEGAEELYRRLYGLHKVASLEQAEHDFTLFARLDEKQKSLEISTILAEMADQNEFVVIVDGGGVYTDDGRYQQIFSDLLSSLDGQGRPCLGFVQTRMMPFSLRQELVASYHQYLKPLSDDVVADLISLSLKEFQVDFSEAQIAQVVQFLDGHPFNVRFAVQYILNYGIDSLINDPSDLIEWKNRRAVDFLKKITFSGIESDVVALLSEYQYLAAATLIEALGGNAIEVTQAVRRLQEYCCVELRENYFHIAAPIRDAVRRDERFDRDDGWKQKIGQLICELVEGYSADDQIPIPIIESATLAAARSKTPPTFLSAFILPSHLLRIAREHYDAGRRRTCMDLCKKAYEMRARLPADAQVELLRLWGLSAVRVSDETIYNFVLNELKKSGSKLARRMTFFLEGFYLRLKGQLDLAEEKFLEAWRLARANESINRELASLYCKERRYADAEVHARAAYEIAPTNPYIIDIFAETLLGKVQAGLSVDRGELDRILVQLKIYGDAPGSSFFLIRDAQQRLKRGDKAGALNSVEKAIIRTPALLAPYFIRAEICLASGDPDGADRDLDKINRLLSDAGGFSEGDEAAAQELSVRIMIERHQFRAAKDAISRLAFLPRFVQKRLNDQLARSIAFEPTFADAKLKEWAKNHRF